jgi:hypothetical protein
LVFYKKINISLNHSHTNSKQLVNKKIITKGNGIILITIKFQARLLSSTSNYFILSLSLADFLVGIVIMPIMLVYTANDQLWTNCNYLTKTTQTNYFIHI